MDIKQLINRPDLPTIGVPMVAGAAQLVQSVTCKCDPTNPPMVIVIDQAVACARCRNLYTIVHAQYTAGQGGLQVMVQHVGKLNREGTGPDAGSGPSERGANGEIKPS